MVLIQIILMKMALLITIIPSVFQLGTCLLLWNIPALSHSDFAGLLTICQWQSLNFNSRIKWDTFYCMDYQHIIHQIPTMSCISTVTMECGLVLPFHLHEECLGLFFSVIKEAHLFLS